MKDYSYHYKKYMKVWEVYLKEKPCTISLNFIIVLRNKYKEKRMLLKVKEKEYKVL